MKNITALKERYEKLYANKFCSVGNISCCPHTECTCRIAAEIRAFIDSVLPDGFARFSIKDFTGRSAHQEELLTSEIALEAKIKIAQYCWGIADKDILKQIEQDAAKLDSMSVMDKRWMRGTNVVIYGTSTKRVVDEENNAKIVEVQKGRTLAASIIMKEAIKRRIDKNNIVQSYDWVHYHSLRKLLSDKSESEYSESRSASWLVVDDIVEPYSSANANSYISSLVDPFFQERVDNGRPTIFVFKFNVLQKDIERHFGVVVNNIIRNPDTFLIRLSD